MLAVSRYGRFVAELFPLGDLQVVCFLFRLVLSHFSLARVDQHVAAQTVNDNQIACFNQRQYIFGANNRRNFQGTGHNRRVRSTSADIGSEAFNKITV
ncbi:hypothetical protein D3C80_1885940 [compost metagenome]